MVSPLVLAEVPGVRKSLANQSPGIAGLGTACMSTSRSLQTLIRVGVGKIFPALAHRSFKSRRHPLKLNGLVRLVAVLQEF